MSQENVEAFRRAVEANNRGDYDAVLEEVDSGIEWRAVFQVKFGGQATTCRGREAVRAYLEDLDEGFSVRRVEISEVRDLGERVVATGHVRGRGRVSGAEIDSPIGFVIDFRNGKVFRMRDYLDSQEALEAAGLSG
ncbi:MAG: nuclear transport factor 2 family protein [Solirubrobacterales bacterium]